MNASLYFVYLRKSNKYIKYLLLLVLFIGRNNLYEWNSNIIEDVWDGRSNTDQESENVRDNPNVVNWELNS